ncbi:MAG: SIMPL domain-containing protein [Candidatus Dormibacterales bacterium]
MEQNPTANVRLVLIAIVLAVALSIAVTAMVMAANRPTVLLTSQTAVTSGSPQAGVLTTGEATVSLKPDLAMVSAGVQSSQSTAAAAQSDLAAKAGKLIARIKGLGVADSDISTSGYYVSPMYEPDGQIVSGYTAAEDLVIKWHNVDTVGRTLDAMVQEGGATRITVGFGLSDPKSGQAQARSQAIAEARSKADAMANASGVRLGQVVRISDLSTATEFPPQYAAGAAPSAVTQVPVGQLDVQVTVEVDFAIA